MLPNDSNPVNLRLIGQMLAWSNKNENLLPPGRKARALLAVLALSGATPVSRSQRGGVALESTRRKRGTCLVAARASEVARGTRARKDRDRACHTGSSDAKGACCRHRR